jgi:colanic acid biosynthesis glycosyl transferase WcaI
MPKDASPIRVAILAQYFPPEGGAPAARLHFMAQSFSAAGMQVKVITATPSYPEGRTYPGYRGKLFMRETRENIAIFRSWAYAHPIRSTLNRVLNYLTFSLTSIYWVRVFRNVDVIVFSEGPMFAGAVGFLAKKLYTKPIILDVRDLWPDRIWEAGILSDNAARAARILRVLEQFMYRNAAAVVGVTNGLCDVLRQRVPEGTPVHLIRNSAQITARESATQISAKTAIEPVVIVESGTQGLYQDPVTLCRAFAALNERYLNDIELRFYGVGPRVPELLTAIRGLPNAEYFGHRTSEHLNTLLRQADIGVVTLQPAELNKLAVSRRVFDYANARLAIVYCGDGEGAETIRQLDAGLVVPAGNAADLTDILERLIRDPRLLQQLKQSSQRLLQGEFADQTIAGKWIEVVRSVC